MENRLSSAKWSRNLNEDSQTEANRLRLLERQRQILETKLQRRQHQTTSSGVVASRPATSVSGARARVSLQTSSDVVSDPNQAQSMEMALNVQDSADTGFSPTITTRARTSIASNRKLASLDSISSTPTGPNASPKSQVVAGNARLNGPMGTVLSSNMSTPGNKSGTGSKLNLRDGRALSRSEANLNSVPVEPAKVTGVDLVNPNPLTTILTDEQLLNFVSQPISPEVTLQCTIIRDKKGLDRSLYPTYYMHLQDIIINHTPGSSSTNDQTTILRSNTGGLEGTATISMSDSVDSLESIKSNDSGKTNQGTAQRNQSTDSEATHNGDSQAQSQNGLKGSTAGSSSNRKVFILSGRRRKKSKTYLIGNNAFDISRDRCLAKLKSNVLGTQFTAIRLRQNGVRYEIASISYETNVLGFKGPRKMAIIIPKPDEKTNVLCNLSLQEEFRRNSRAILMLKNKTPIWNEETQSYVLNFHGRVTQASVKNFQLVVFDASTARPKTGGPLSEMRRSASSHQLRQRNPTADSGINSSTSKEQSDEDDEDMEEDSEDETYSAKNHQFASTRPMSKSLTRSGYLSASSSEDAKNMSIDPNELVSLQFGRVSNTQFSCDVSWPLSLLQAFAIALSSFDSKLACE